MKNSHDLESDGMLDILTEGLKYYDDSTERDLPSNLLPDSMIGIPETHLLHQIEKLERGENYIYSTEKNHTDFYENACKEKISNISESIPYSTRTADRIRPIEKTAIDNNNQANHQRMKCKQTRPPRSLNEEKYNTEEKIRRDWPSFLRQ